MSDVEVLFVVGTRPEIIKTAPVIAECRRRDLPIRVVHTGQHYSESLHEVFFRQFDLAPPDTNLEVGSGDHGEQTGAMLAGIDQEITTHTPSVVVVQGDTNSTLAGALAGAKREPDVAHIEAGLRSFDRDMPEEMNRIIIDHIADQLFPPTAESAARLREEGISPDRTTITGNTVVDAVTAYDAVARSTSTVLDEFCLEPGSFGILTAHRAETVDSKTSFASVLEGVGTAADRLGIDVIYPIHPRAQQRLTEFELTLPASIRIVDPLGFFDFLRLESAAAIAFTDSGGVQEETCILGTPCVTLRYGTERPETAFVGANCIAGHDAADIIDAALAMDGKVGEWKPPFGDGHAAERICDAISPHNRHRTQHPTD